MKKLLFALIIVLVAGCNAAKKGQPVSGILQENMDPAVKPGDNFYNYVNGTWVTQTVIPDDKSSYGIFTILAEEAEEKIRTIIEEASSGDFEEGSDEQKVGDLYNSYTDMEQRNLIGTTPLLEELGKIDAISDYEELAVYFAYAGKYYYSVPIIPAIFADMKNPGYNAAYIVQYGLGLPEREYYLKEDERSQEIRTAYQSHIERMFGLAGLEDGEGAARTIMALETRLAEKQMEKEATRDFVNLYNSYRLDELASLMPGFNWEGYLAEAGLSGEEHLVVGMVDYTRDLNDIITGTALDTWKTYLKWGVLNVSAGSLNEELDQQDFAFYQKELQGTQEQRPLWRRGIETVNANLGEVVGKVYVQKHFPPEAKERMVSLVDNLLKAYDESIRELDWMGEETRNEALRKLGKFTAKIGYPDRWRDYSDLIIHPDDLFGNMRNAYLFEYNRNLAKLGKPIDRSEWGMTPQTVNAYYNPTLNEIVFPAAILQPPFFNLEAEDAVNYGAIGAAIGHEIGHGFDDSGSRFDGDGMLRDWWTETDREEFNKRTGVLVDQYNRFEVLPGVHVNGEFTLGENIGDLGGLSIALKAYHISQDGGEGPVIDGFTADQRIFLGWGQVWKNKQRSESLRVKINTDPHPPAVFRVNGAVRNIPAFYTAFNITEQDSMYLAPDQRVKIW